MARLDGFHDLAKRARFLAAITVLGTACGADAGEEGSGGSSASCDDPISDETCDGTPCGGDIVGTWGLVTFCGPSCVSSVYETVSFDAAGSYNGGQGTWAYVDDDTFSITVGNATANHSYCVSGNRFWSQVGTNCGPGMSGPISITRLRDCGGDDPPRR